MNALYFERFGGPEALHFGAVPDPQATPGTAVVKTAAIGLNFADIYRRRGNYHLTGTAPFVAGYEAAGRVTDAGTNPPAWVRVPIAARFSLRDGAAAHAFLESRAAIGKVVLVP